MVVDACIKQGALLVYNPEVAFGEGYSSNKSLVN